MSNITCQRVRKCENGRKKKTCLTEKKNIYIYTYCCYNKNTVCYLLVAKVIKLQSNHCLNKHRIIGLIINVVPKKTSDQREHLELYNSNICKHVKISSTAVTNICMLHKDPLLAASSMWDKNSWHILQKQLPVFSGHVGGRGLSLPRAMHKPQYSPSMLVIS